MKKLIGKLRGFAQLELDWDSYGARPIAPEAIALAEKLLHAAGATEQSPEYECSIAPTHSGGVRIDWSSTDEEAEDDNYVEVLIDAEARLHWLLVSSGAANEVEGLTLEAVVEKVADALKVQDPKPRSAKKRRLK